MTAQQQQQRGAWAKDGATYWAVFTRHPDFPCIHGSHYSTRVDSTADGAGHVFTSEAGARDYLAILPTHYRKDDGSEGRAIGWEVGRVLHSGGYFYDVLSCEASELRAGMRVMTGPDRWQTIASIEYHSHAGGITRGADVYRVSWVDVLAADPNAAPSLLSSRRGLYDVLRTEY